MLQKMLILGLAGGLLGCLAADAALEHHGFALIGKLHPSRRSYVLALTGLQRYASAVGLAPVLAVLPGLAGVLAASRTDPADTLREG
jgi:hypothetical protein